MEIAKFVLHYYNTYFGEAGEGPSRVGGFKLRDGVVAPSCPREIEAAQLIIKDAGELNREGSLAGRELEAGSTSVRDWVCCWG